MCTAISRATHVQAVALHLQVLEDNAEEFQYLKAVEFVKRVKKGPLQETSPLLCDISAVPSWEKVTVQLAPH